MSIQVEPSKLLIRQQDILGDFASSFVPELVKSYVKVLPEVNYTAIGTNFHAFAEMDEPSGKLVKGFIDCSGWAKEDSTLSSGGVKLVYEILGLKLTLTLDPGVQDGAGSQRSGLIVRANYHVVIDANPGVRSFDSVVRAADGFGLYAEDFSKRVPRLLGLLESKDA